MTDQQKAELAALAAMPDDAHAYPHRLNCHCERSAAISLEQGALLPKRDRHVAALLAMTNWVRMSRR